MALSITTEMSQDGKVATLDLVGEIDSLTAREFKKELEAAFVESEKLGTLKYLVLNLEGLEFMSSAGLRVFIFANQTKPDLNIHVIKPQEAILDALEKTGLMHSVKIVSENPES